MPSQSQALVSAPQGSFTLPPVSQATGSTDTTASDLPASLIAALRQPEEWESGATAPAPQALPSRTTGSCTRRHGAWLNFTRRYVHANYERHLIGTTNLRYRGRSFAEHCHHPTVDWDNHPFCPACYVLFDLPKCTKGMTPACKFCAMNSMETDVARATRMQAGTKFPSAANRDIPLNCYTQADLDV